MTEIEEHYEQALLEGEKAYIDSEGDLEGALVAALQYYTKKLHEMCEISIKKKNTTTEPTEE